jgi:hypothetical protein
VALHRGLTIEEANNELTFLVTGMYGKPALKQMGAPLRSRCRGSTASSRSSRSCASSSPTAAEDVLGRLQAAEYGFWANVNPEVPHPRWSQASEEDIAPGSSTRREVQRLRRVRRRSLQRHGERALADGVRGSRRAAIVSVEALQKKNRALAGPVAVLAGLRRQSPFQRGNSWLHTNRHLGGTTTGCLQRDLNMRCVADANNVESRMSAMRGGRGAREMQSSSARRNAAEISGNSTVVLSRPCVARRPPSEIPLLCFCDQEVAEHHDAG